MDWGPTSPVHCKSIFVSYSRPHKHNASDPIGYNYTNKYSDRVLKLNSRADEGVKFKLPWVQKGIACDDFIYVQVHIIMRL